jgi:dethiobiotin synthetase
VVIGSWPDQPGLAERSNLVDLSGVLTGSMPEGAGRLGRDDFRAAARSAVTAPAASAGMIRPRD